MMIRFIPTERSKREARRFVELAEELGNPGADATRPIQDVIRATFAANFARESGNDQKWPALALRTIRERIRLGYPGDHPILVRSGDYRRSFIEGDDPNHYSRIETAGGTWQIEEGSTDKRAGTLEFGRGPVPPRPVTLPGRSGEERIATVINDLFARWFEEDQS